MVEETLPSEFFIMEKNMKVNYTIFNKKVYGQSGQRQLILILFGR